MVSVVILVLVILAVVIFGGAAYLNPKNKNVIPSQTVETEVSSATPSSTIEYKNLKYGYRIEYPKTFAFSENSNKSGISLIPEGGTTDSMGQAIWVTVIHKSGDPSASPTPLSEYSKTAASQEIQGYDELASRTVITTKSGEVGYRTTWRRSPPPIVGQNYTGTSEPSDPITYFELPEEPYYTVQIHLNDEAYLPEYEEIIKSFSTK